MKSASNGGVLKGRIQVLHVHVLLVAPLGISHLLQVSQGPEDCQELALFANIKYGPENHR